MTVLLISVEESKSKFIIQLLKEFNYVKIKKVPRKHSAEDKRILDSISATVKNKNKEMSGRAKPYLADMEVLQILAQFSSGQVFENNIAL